MPPKAGKGKPAKKPPPVIVDGVNTSQLSREKLEQLALKIKDELEKEREQRNYFQVERDKVRIFWEITLQQLDEAKAELRNRERDTEEAQEESAALMETQKQKIKHLKYEQQATAAAMRAESLQTIKSAKEEHAQQELELLQDKRSLMDEIKERMLSAQNELRRAKLIQAEELSRARTKYQEKLKEIEGKAHLKLNQCKSELTVRHRTELSEVEERKNKQLADLIRFHGKAFSDLKTYYNDITLNNLGLISSLKKQMEALQKAKSRAEKAARDSLTELKNLKEPLAIAIEKNQEFTRQMANYDKDKALLATKTKQVECIEKQYEVLKWEFEILEVRFDRILAERNELKRRMSRAVYEVQQKQSLKTTLMEAKIHNYESRNLQHKDVYAIVQEKDLQIEDLRYEASRLRKAHDDLLATYEAKLAKLGVPLEELGFKPLKSHVIAGLDTIVGRGPAGLITKNQ